METIPVHFKRVTLLAILACLIGCSPKAFVTEAKGKSPEKKGTDAVASQGPKTRVSNKPANTNGSVFVVEYHHIRKGKGDMFRTADAFRKDLEHMYEQGFRPVLASEYLSNKMDLAPG